MMNVKTNSTTNFFFVQQCCVCERERERERRKTKQKYPVNVLLDNKDFASV